MATREHTHKVRRKTFRRWREAGWKTRDEAYKAFRQIVRNVVDAGRVGQPLPEQYHEFVAWLVSGHPQEEELVGAGVRYFLVCVCNRRRKDYGRYSFGVVDNNGVERHFSLGTALDGMNSTRRTDLMNAFREEVREQILYVRRQSFNQRCPETGELLTENNCEIDHAGAAFEALVRTFLCNAGLTLQDIECFYDAAALGQHQHTLFDRKLAAAWSAFHWRFAQLQAVSREGHRRRTYERRNNPLYGLST